MKKITLIALFLLFAGIDASAQLKIGYTNPELILSQLPEIQEINQEIGLLYQEKDSLLAAKAVVLQKEFDDYNSIKDGLTQAERQQREQVLVQKNQDFEQERQQSLNEVQQRQVALLQPLEQKVFDEIKNVADSLGLDLVLNEGSANGGSFIFYASEEQVNITEMVLENLKQS